MTDPLPAGWKTLDTERAMRFLAAFREEMPDWSKEYSERLTIIAFAESCDDILLRVRDVEPAHFLYHLTWSGRSEEHFAMPQPVEDLSKLS